MHSNYEKNISNDGACYYEKKIRSVGAYFIALLSYWFHIGS